VVTGMQITFVLAAILSAAALIISVSSRNGHGLESRPE
jgi:hypothetical protein